MIESTPAPTATATKVARIGPNALIQTVRALREQYDDALVRGILETTGQTAMLDHEPTEMVPEHDFAVLVAATAARLGPAAAGDILHTAGRYTADYLLAHRIPGPFQRLLRPLPARPALAALLFAISKHAWTFTGSGIFEYSLRGRPELTVLCNITPGAAAHRFYGGAFEHLILTLIDPHARFTMSFDTWSDQQFLCRYVVQFRY